MKAVIVAAGYGSRFLPITKTVPKEMLPIFDKTLLDLILDEIEDAGIKDVIVITSRRKRVLEDYLDREVELECALEKAKKTKLLETIRPRNLNFEFIRQREMMGTGHALLSCRAAIGNEAFVVAYPDDIVISKPGLTRRMVETYNKTGQNLLAVREEAGDVSRFGVIEPYREAGEIKVRSIVEKPAIGTEPSHLISIGRYLFTPELLDLLDKAFLHHQGGEFYHIGSINKLAASGKVSACVVEGLMLDTGEPGSYFNSLLEYAFRHPVARPILDRFVKDNYS